MRRERHDYNTVETVKTDGAAIKKEQIGKVTHKGNTLLK